MRVVIWCFVMPFTVWAVLRLAGGEPAWQWVPLVAFTPYAAAAGALPLVLAAAVRRWAAAGVALVSVVAMALAVLPRWLPDGNPAASGAALRVLAANLRVGQGDAAELVALVKRLKPDVLALQELTPEARDRLEEHGLRDLLPHAVDRSVAGVGGSGVYARYPLREEPPIMRGSFGQARAVLRPGGGPEVEVVSVHPCAPRHDARVACWREGLDALPRGGGRLRVLAGDFNATLDHAPMRELLDSGYRDAADVTGQGFTPTWPELNWEFLPGVAIDHVLASPAIAVTSFSAHALSGTDHRPVFAELRLP